MDDLIQLGAYVVIILVIGGASVIKKIIEAQRRRKEMEQAQGKTLRVEPTYSQETQERYPIETEEPEGEIILESESESQSGGKPRIEDILKEVFNIPTAPRKRTTIVRNIPSNLEEKPQPAERQPMTDEVFDEDALTHSETVTPSAEPSWEVFATGLKGLELTEIQRAIVMSELIQKPSSRRIRSH